MLYYERTMIKSLILLFSLAFAGNRDREPNAEKEVLDAMNTWRQAMVARDRAVLEKLYDPGLSYTHSNGRQENKEEAIEAVVNGKDRIESIELTEAAVKVYGATALVKAKLILRISSGDTVNTLNLDVLHVWIKGPSGWRMAARHALRLNP